MDEDRDKHFADIQAALAGTYRRTVVHCADCNIPFEAAPTAKVVPVRCWPCLYRHEAGAPSITDPAYNRATDPYYTTYLPSVTGPRKGWPTNV